MKGLCKSISVYEEGRKEFRWYLSLILSDNILPTVKGGRIKEEKMERKSLGERHRIFLKV